MARLRKNETSAGIQGASAAPARRKSASTPRKRTTAQPETVGEMESQETVAAAEPVAAIAVESVIVPAGTPEVIPAVIETVLEAVPDMVAEIVTVVTPSRDEIAALAYSYWVQRGYANGCPEQDWLRAETELRERALAIA
jgi:hypothetical protein